MASSRLVYDTAAAALHAAQAGGGAAAVPAPLAWDPARHAISRFGFGATPTFPTTTAFDPDAWWSDQVNLAQQYPGYTALPAIGSTFPGLNKSPVDTRTWLATTGNQYGWDSMVQLECATLSLQIWSVAQLFETVVDLFSNHLNVANFSDSVWASRASFDLDVIRKYAFGNFSDMLVAAGQHPAMMTYLNNAESTKSAPNENYGREVLELHTVGVDAGYTQTDVVNSARIFTGRGWDWETSGYAYLPDEHFVGPVNVLAFKNANKKAAGGPAVGDAYLRYLAGHPSTAQQIARKMCVRFVSDTPSAALVTAVANAFRQNKTAILPALSVIYRSKEFWAARGAKIRRPAENLVATARVLGVTPVDFATAGNTLTWMSQAVGQPPLAWAPPNGYPDVGAAWRSSGTMLNLWNLQLGLASGWWSDALTGPTATDLYGGTAPTTVGGALDALTRHLTGVVFSTDNRQTLLAYLGEAPTLPLSQSRLAYEVANVAALVLHSPHHALR